MRLLERYFLSRIDRALDDGKPLTGLTRWMARRNDRLRHYYESMLALELELRFSDEIPLVVARKASSVPRKSRRLIWTGAAVAACLLIAIGLVFHRPQETPTTVDVTATPNDVFPELLSAVLPLEGIDESLIDFSERPLELTSMFVTQVGSIIATRSNVDF